MKKTKLFLPAMAIGLLLSMGLTACNQPANNSQGNQSTNSQQSTQQKERITVTAAGDKKSLALNETVQLTAKVGDAVIEGVTWSSSDAAIVTVDETGKVTAVGYGEASITAKKDGYNNGTIGITVPRPAASATFDLTTAAEHYSADGWWELPTGGMGFAMQTVNGWNPVAQNMSWGQQEENPETFIGGFGVGDKETIKFAASKAEKAELMLNIGNSDEANLAEIMSIKLNGAAVSLTGKTLEAHAGDWGNSLEFGDVSLGNLDIAAANTLEIEFLQATNIFLNELAVYAKEATVTLTNPAAKQQIEVVNDKLEVIVEETVNIQVKNNLAGVTYVSSDETIAAVSNAGVVTGVKVGKTNVTVKKEGMYSVRLEITVKPKPVAGQILVEAESAEELAELTPGSFNMSGPSIMQDGGMMGGSEVHSGSAYVMNFGSDGLTLTMKFQATANATMVLSVVGSSPVGGEAAAYVLKNGMSIKLNNNNVTIPETAEFPAPEGYTASMAEVVIGDVAVKSGENTLVVTIEGSCPSLDVFKLSVK